MFITTPPPPPPKPITIWVHGTRPSSVFSFLANNQKLKKAADGTIQSTAGLMPITQFDAADKTYTLLKTLSAAAPHLFPEQTFYSFGWSGALDLQARKLAAQYLLESIRTLVADYTATYNIAPPITLITHSHGGNVAISMALLIQDTLPFYIERTILLAIPVQKETAHLINHPLFGKVYSLHSHMDVIQIIDPQRLQPYKQAFTLWQETKSIEQFRDAYFLSKAQPFFSERHFPITSNIIQANICWKSLIKKPIQHANRSHKIEFFFNSLATKIINQKRGVLHTEFITPTFICHLPNIIQQLDHHIIAHGVCTDDIEIMI